MEFLGAVILGLVALWLVLIVALFLLRPQGVKAAELVRLIPDVVRLARDLVLDPAMPRGVRVSLVVLAAWLISPIDLIPEFIPVLGPVDDAIVTVIVLRYVRRRLGIETLRSRWAGTPDGFRSLESIVGR